MARDTWEQGIYQSVGNAPWVCYPALQGRCYAVARDAGQKKLHLLLDHPGVREALAAESLQRMEDELLHSYRVSVAAMEEGVTSIYDPGWFQAKEE